MSSPRPHTNGTRPTNGRHAPDRPAPRADAALARALDGLAPEELLREAPREHVLYLWVSAAEDAEIRALAGLLGLSAGDYLRRLHQRARPGLLASARGSPDPDAAVDLARAAHALGLSVEAYCLRLHELARRRAPDPAE